MSRYHVIVQRPGPAILTMDNAGLAFKIINIDTVGLRPPNVVSTAPR